MEAHALYIHIPFCRSICTYCAFNTYADLENLIEPYMSALCVEIQSLKINLGKIPLKSIYLGGGTPSLVPVDAYQHVFETIHDVFNVLPDAEITLEANPNDSTLPAWKALGDLGFNRLSIGMQSSHPRDLQLFNRRHDYAMVIEAVENARKAGFDNYSLDLIYGIPHQTLSEWRDSLSDALALNPNHISLYALELKDGTPLTNDVITGQVPTPDDDLTADMYDVASEVLARAGLEQYEISNWARPGQEGQHNLQYWYNLPYLGIGAGAHGYVNGQRTIVIRNPQRYIAACSHATQHNDFPQTPATAKMTKVDTETEIAETLMMGLRLTQVGVNRQVFRDRFKLDVLDIHAEMFQRFADLGILEITEQRIRFTDRGRFLSNAVFRELI